MAKLRLKRKKEVKDLTAQVENLEQALNYLKAHPEERHQAMTPFAYARRIRAKRYCALNSQINNHKRWISLCSGWAIPRGIVEQVQHNVVYVRHQHTRAKFKRLSLAGVFLDEEKDRITITQTGITLDEQFPFVEGENRSNGMQW
ncbi:unnamed protein product [Aphanomyces euteiches]